jgi:hypothetical protein
VRRGRATWYQKVEAGAGKAPLPAQARPATTPVATAPPAPASPQSRPPEAGPAPTGAAVDLNVVMQRLKDMNAKYDK